MVVVVVFVPASLRDLVSLLPKKGGSRDERVEDADGIEAGVDAVPVVVIE